MSKGTETKVGKPELKVKEAARDNTNEPKLLIGVENPVVSEFKDNKWVDINTGNYVIDSVAALTKVDVEYLIESLTDWLEKQ